MKFIFILFFIVLGLSFLEISVNLEFKPNKETEQCTSQGGTEVKVSKHWECMKPITNDLDDPTGLNKLYHLNGK